MFRGEAGYKNFIHQCQGKHYAAQQMHRHLFSFLQVVGDTVDVDAVEDHVEEVHQLGPQRRGPRAPVLGHLTKTTIEKSPQILVGGHRK